VLVELEEAQRPLELEKQRLGVEAGSSLEKVLSQADVEEELARI